MNFTPIPLVTIRCNEGLVTIPSLKGKKLNSKYSMWNDIIATEFLPANDGTGAFYILTLFKPAVDIKGVDSVEAELSKAHELLARCWIFSGGMEMSNTLYEVVFIPQLEVNADEVKERILAGKGLKRVSSSTVVNVDIGAQYARPPLESAVQIASAMHKDPVLAKLLEYHHNARTNYYRGGSRKASWFIDLYKVRDLLRDLYGSDKTAQQDLNFSDSEWRHIGKVLNNGDYRHADRTGVAPQAAPADIQRLFEIALRLVTAHLRKWGMHPVAVP